RSRAEPGRMRVPDRRVCAGGGAVCLASDSCARLRRSRRRDPAVPRPLRDDGGHGPGESYRPGIPSAGRSEMAPGCHRGCRAPGISAPLGEAQPIAGREPARPARDDRPGTTRHDGCSHGAGAPLAYVLLGSIQGMFFGDYQGGLRLARIGLELVERPGFERFQARVYSVFGVHVSNWTQPLHVARAYLGRAFDAAQASGDVSFAAFSCIDLITNLLAAGTPLSEVEREAEKNREIVKGLGFSVVRRGISEQLAAIRMLRGTVPPGQSFGDAVLEADRHEDL